MCLFTSCNNINQETTLTEANAISSTPNEFTVDTKQEHIIANDVTSITESELYLSDFQPPEYNKLTENDSFIINITDTNVLKLYEEALHIRIFYFDFIMSSYFERLGQVYDNDGNKYEQSGIAFDSFVEYLNTLFTDNYLDTLLYSEPTAYKNINGELCYREIGDGVSNPALDTITISIQNADDEKIEIVATARYCHPDTPDDEYFKECYCTMILTSDGWKIDNLETWF